MERVDPRRPSSSGHLLPGVGGIGAGDGSRHVSLWVCQKDTFSAPKFIHSESIPSRPKSGCREKKKKKPRQQVECGGGKEAGREDRQVGAREGQRGTGEEGNLEGRGEGWAGEEGVKRTGRCVRAEGAEIEGEKDKVRGSRGPVGGREGRRVQCGSYLNLFKFSLID